MPRNSNNTIPTRSSETAVRDSKLKALLKNRKPVDPMDWSAVDGAWIVAFTAAVANEGGAVTLGYTRGAAAYRVGVYLADEREDMYFTDVELMYQWMKAFMDDLGAL